MTNEASSACHPKVVRNSSSVCHEYPCKLRRQDLAVCRKVTKAWSLASWREGVEGGCRMGLRETSCKPMPNRYKDKTFSTIKLLVPFEWWSTLTLKKGARKPASKKWPLKIRTCWYFHWCLVLGKVISWTVAATNKISKKCISLRATSSTKTCLYGMNNVHC